LKAVSNVFFVTSGAWHHACFLSLAVNGIMRVLSVAVNAISKLSWQVQPETYDAGGPSHEVAACALARALIIQNKTLSLAMSLPGSLYNEDFFMSQCYQKVRTMHRVVFCFR
jgi:hypothetical protein